MYYESFAVNFSTCLPMFAIKEIWLHLSIGQTKKKVRSHKPAIAKKKKRKEKKKEGQLGGKAQIHI